MGFRGCRYNETKLAELLGVDVDTLKDAMSKSMMGVYATVWSVESISDTNTKLNITITQKNKETQEYDKKFTGNVNCYGTAVAKKAANLKKGARIMLGDVDVENKYNKEKETMYTFYKVFSFDVVSEGSTQTEQTTEPQPTVDSGEVNDEQLPF